MHLDMEVWDCITLGGQLSRADELSARSLMTIANELHALNKVLGSMIAEDGEQ